MEPFRPLVDLTVARMTATGEDAVTPEAKRKLAGLLSCDMQTKQGTTTLLTCLERLAASLAKAFEAGDAVLDLPLTPLPLDLTPVER